MENKGFLPEGQAFKNLKKYYDENGTKINILDMFEKNPKRFDEFRYDIESIRILLR